MAELLRIGEVALRSGLTVTALRFYDRAGVLTPADVDVMTGYRRYTRSQVHHARVVASLRRIGMPPSEMAVLLAHLADVDTVRDLIADHLRRLDEGVVAARREAHRLAELLESGAPGDSGVNGIQGIQGMEAAEDWLDLPAGAVARALEAVRFACADPGVAPEFGVLTGVLIRHEGCVLRVAATDRYRLAVTTVAGRGSHAGGPREVVLDAADADRWVPVLLGSRDVRLTWLAEGRLRLESEDHRETLAGLEGCYPDIDQLAPAGWTETVEQPRIEAADDVTARVEALVSRWHHGREIVSVASGMAADHDGTTVDVDRGFLLEAVRALPGGQLSLALDGPLAPLVLRHPTDADTYSLVMPCAPEREETA